MAKRKPKAKAHADDLPAPGERQRCRFPAQWDHISPEQRRTEEARAQQLINGEPIDGTDLYGPK